MWGFLLMVWIIGGVILAGEWFDKNTHQPRWKHVIITILSGPLFWIVMIFGYILDTIINATTKTLKWFEDL